MIAWFKLFSTVHRIIYSNHQLQPASSPTTLTIPPPPQQITFIVFSIKNVNRETPNHRQTNIKREKKAHQNWKRRIFCNKTCTSPFTFLFTSPSLIFLESMFGHVAFNFTFIFARHTLLFKFTAKIHEFSD
jgi:hypothetical protein